MAMLIASIWMRVCNRVSQLVAWMRMCNGSCLTSLLRLRLLANRATWHQEGMYVTNRTTCVCVLGFLVIRRCRVDVSNQLRPRRTLLNSWLSRCNASNQPDDAGHHSYAGDLHCHPGARGSLR